MTKRSLLIATMIAVTGTAADAAPPAWCSAPQIRDADTNMQSALGNDARDALANLVGASCSKDREAVSQEKELAAARARWEKELGLTAAQWESDVVPWATRTRVERNSPTLRDEPKAAPSTLGPIGQYARIHYVQMESGDAQYVTDALGDKLTEAGRLAYIEECIKSTKPVIWALCQPDIDAFDRGKVFAEVGADTGREGYERTTVRLAAYGLKARLEAHAAKTKELIGKDPGYAKLFEVAAQARKGYSADPAMLAVAAAMDDARVTNSTKKFEGCDETTWSAFQTAVSKLPAAKFKDLKRDTYVDEAMNVVVNDPDAYLAALSVYLCRGTKGDMLARSIGQALQYWPGYRGPRTAGFTAIRGANIALDQRDAKIEYPRYSQKFISGRGNQRGGGAGAVSAVKPGGDKTTIEFVAKLRKEQVCTDWKDTNHVVQILANGSVIYDYICTKYGTITINDAPGPKAVSPRYAAGAKAGATVIVDEDLVTVVFPKPGAAPSHVLGVSVK